MPILTAERPLADQGKRFVIHSEFQPAGDQPQAIDGAGRGRPGRRGRSGAAGRHRLGQDLHHGACHRADAAPGADPRAEQDPGGAALWRDEELLPRQRGRVFRLLLRLLPARGLCAADRHLHREGILDQRADRPHAPFGDARDPRAARHDHRRLGLVHLRHRLGRDLFRDDVAARSRHQREPHRAVEAAGRAAIPPQRHEFRARQLPRARRHDRALPGPLRGPRLAAVAVRRRDRGDPRIRSADRREEHRARRSEDLSEQPLRHAQADAVPGDRADQDAT